MQIHKSFDIAPTGKINSYEEFFLTEGRGNWVINNFIDKKVFEYDSSGRLTSEMTINPSNNEINVESHLFYQNGLIVNVTNKTKWGISTTNNTYDESKLLVKKLIENSNGNKHSYGYEYDILNRLTKTTSEFTNKTDVYNYEFLIDGDIEIKTIKCNGALISTEFIKNGLLVKFINRDNESIEYTYDKNGLILSETKKDIKRTFNYSKNGLPCEYLGFINETDYNKEFYEFDFDEFGNWIEIKCFNENANFPKHLKSIKKRKINYT